MKISISVGLVAIAALFTAVFISTTVNAQTTPTTPATPTTKSQAIRCDIAQAHLNTRITQVDTVKETQTKLYAELQTKIDALVTSAKEAQYDTTDMVAAQASIKEKVTAYTTAATSYGTSLMATKNLSCGESDTAFATSLGTTRQALTTTRLATVAAAKEFRDSAIPALQAYAAWLKQNTVQNETE